MIGAGEFAFALSNINWQFSMVKSKCRIQVVLTLQLFLGESQQGYILHGLQYLKMFSYWTRFFIIKLKISWNKTTSKSALNLVIFKKEWQFWDFTKPWSQPKIEPFFGWKFLVFIGEFFEKICILKTTFLRI